MSDYRPKGLTLLAGMCTIAVLATFAGGATAAGYVSIESPTVGSPSAISAATADLLDLAAVEEEVELRPGDLDALVALRDRYGLSTDRRYIAELHSDPQSHAAVSSTSHLLGGIVLGAEEVPEAERRARAEWDSLEVNDLATRALGDRYVATEVVEDSLVVHCVDCGAADENELVALTGGLDSEVSVHEVPLRTSVLREIADDLADRLNESAVSFTNVYVDAPEGQVVVELTRDSLRSAQSEELAGLLEHEAAVVKEVASESIGYYTKYDTLPNNWVEGGQAINWSGNLSPASYACTSGFAVEHPYYGSFILTAGHCNVGADSSTWTQGIYNLGDMTAVNHSGSYDAAMISTSGNRTNRGRFHQTSTNWQEPITFQVSGTPNVLGQTFCTSGRTWTGSHGTSNAATRCGTVASMWATGSPGPGYGPFTSNFFRVDGMGGVPGDSGAVVYWPTIYGHGGAGMVQGGPELQPTPPWALVTKQYTVASNWGVTLTSCSC